MQKTRTIVNAVHLVRGQSKLYFAHFHDSRGRIYAYSELHPITNKFTRSVIAPAATLKTFAPDEVPSSFHKYLTTLKFIDFDKIDARINERVGLQAPGGYEPSIYTYQAKPRPLFFRDVYSKFNKFVYLIALVEVGKLRKTELFASQNNPAKGLTFADLATEGAAVIWSLEHELRTFSDLEDITYLTKIKLEVDFFQKEQKWRNFSINKDSPASALQH